MAYRNQKFMGVDGEIASASLIPFRLPAADDAGLTTPKNLFEITFNRLTAALLIILLSPLFLVISALIFLRSGGPVFYSQRRVGRLGVEFKIFKFRTMVNGAHSLKSQLSHLNFMSGPFFKIKNDPRLTPEGGLLRRWSLDELPQLFNVLRGEMSLIGPRPMLPEEIRELKCRDILTVPPGITGLWQVSGRSEVVDFQQKITLDRIYVRKKSFILDLSILIRTVGVVLLGRGAY